MVTTIIFIVRNYHKSKKKKYSLIGRLQFLHWQKWVVARCSVDELPGGLHVVVYSFNLHHKFEMPTRDMSMQMPLAYTLQS